MSFLMNSQRYFVPAGGDYTTVTWVTATKPTSSAARYVVDNGAERVFAAGQSVNNTLWTSTGGGNFTALTLPTPTTSQAVAVIAKNNAGTILAMGESGTCSWISTDNGVSWTVYNFSSVVISSGSTGGLCYVNGYWQWSVGDSSGLSYNSYSADGATWTGPTAISGAISFQGAAPALIAKSDELSAVGNSANFGYKYAWNTSGTTWTLTDVSSPYANSMGNGSASSMTYTPAWGWFLVWNASTSVKRFTTVTEPQTKTHVSYTHGANGGASSVALLTNSGRTPVIAVGAWTADSTVRLNFNLIGGNAWVTSTLPSNTNAFYMNAAGGKFFIWDYTSTTVLIGTPS
jgi:hypothetical protein